MEHFHWYLKVVSLRITLLDLEMRVVHRVLTPTGNRFPKDSVWSLVIRCVEHTINRTPHTTLLASFGKSSTAFGQDYHSADN